MNDIASTAGFQRRTTRGTGDCFDRVTTGRATIFTGGRPRFGCPDHRDGWGWEPYAVNEA